ncbi:bifunctional 2-polyprenyl-6-hydroxyphenol methylase/3-demethylubiquinol 3-O-methyltransferase UbiG [Kutzneria buriramensis]|uniref:Methyltransferase family protein n=1 Tax=Kutzneria buriramensis TaxID=1045776 RepID=A0A3E0H3Q3_9PSEU|nr:class I SAM-dependent methyltransferase [Kutzneria buriramensis]REH37178.1 methyltransferase family protein [Kutzneria buriramensis]
MPITPRSVAESFGVDPVRYDRNRPPYPDDLIARIAQGSPGPRLLNVGAGTGIEARQFQALGCTVLGVEPDARMAEFARTSGVETEVSRFEDWKPCGRRFDGVVSGTAWHWVDAVAGARKAAEVLEPGGRLATFWHVFDLPKPIAQAFATVYKRAVPDAPFDFDTGKTMLELYQRQFDLTADAMRQAGFDEPEQWRYDWECHYTRDEWLELLSTHGGMTALSDDRRAEVLAGVAPALGDGFTLPYVTVAVTAKR